MAPSLLNPRARIRVARQGDEAQPVIVIDDMLAAPEHWRAAAAGARYRRIGPHYPGLRAVVPAEAAAAMREALAGPVGETFGLDPVPPVLETYFSIVTTPPAALAPIQRLPHFDGFEPERIAILIYLSGAEQGGAGVAEHGLPPAAYIAGDTPLYERIALYEARPNRALIYRGHSLHCAAIPAGVPLPAEPAQGRLSINSFLFDPRRL